MQKEQLIPMNTKKHIAVIVLYALLAGIATYPLIAHLNEPLGTNPQDNLSFMWNFWWVEKALTEGKELFYTDYLYYPTGISMVYTDLTLVNTMVGIVIAKFSDYVTAFNLLMLLTIIFGAYTMFLLLKYLTNNAAAAFLGGYIYAFGPWHIYKINSSLIWASIEFVPLFVLFLFKTAENPTTKNALLMALFLTLTFYASIPYAFMMVLFSLIYAAYLFATKKWTRALIKKCALAAVLFTLAVSPVVTLMITRYGDHAATTNPGFDLATYIARTTVHVFMPASVTKTVLSVTALILAVAGLVWLWKKRKQNGVCPGMWLASLLIFFLFSLGDKGIKIGKAIYFEQLPLPAYFMRQIPPLDSFEFAKSTFMVVFLTAILAGYGCKLLLEWLETRADRKTLYAGIGLLFMVIMLDITTVLIPSDNELFSERRMDAYRLLAARGTPDDVVLNLPVANWVERSRVVKADLTHVRNMMAQTIHGKRIMGGYRSRVAPEYTERLNALKNTDPEKLKEFIDFVVVYKSYLYPYTSPNSPYSCEIQIDPKGKEFIEKAMERFAEAKIYEDNALIIYDLQKLGGKTEK